MYTYWTSYGVTKPNGEPIFISITHVSVSKSVSSYGGSCARNRTLQQCASWTTDANSNAASTARTGPSGGWRSTGRRCESVEGSTSAWTCAQLRPVCANRQRSIAWNIELTSEWMRTVKYWTYQLVLLHIYKYLHILYLFTYGYLLHIYLYTRTYLFTRTMHIRVCS